MPSLVVWNLIWLMTQVKGSRPSWQAALMLSTTSLRLNFICDSGESSGPTLTLSTTSLSLSLWNIQDAKRTDKYRYRCVESNLFHMIILLVHLSPWNRTSASHFSHHIPFPITPHWYHTSKWLHTNLPWSVSNSRNFHFKLKVPDCHKSNC